MKRKLAACLMLLIVLGSISLSGVGETAEVLHDGLYSIAVDSDSKMFKVVQCLLSVRDGQILATITLSGQGYGYVYPGTAAEADAAAQSDWAPFIEGSDGKYRYEIPVAALDQPIPVAGWSKKYEKWYDRMLNFRSDTMKEYALVPEDGQYTAQAEVDGEWTICTLDVDQGKMQVCIDREGWETFELPSLDLEVSIASPEGQNAQSHWVFVSSKSLSPVQFVPEDGQYTLNCEADSGLFRVENCQVQVQNGEIQVVIQVQKDSYSQIWLGPADKARLASPDEYIAAQPDGEGGCTYSFHLDALREDLSISTWSEAQKAWYARNLHFDLDGLESY